MQLSVYGLSGVHGSGAFIMKIFKNTFHDWSFTTYYIDDVATATKVAEKLPRDKLLGLDIETAKLDQYTIEKKDKLGQYIGLEPHPMAGLCPLLSRIRLLQIYNGEDKVYVFDLFYISLPWLKNLLSTGRFVAHNAVFEISHLTHAGVPNVNAGCSMLLSQLVNGAEHSPFEPSEDDEDDTDQTGLAIYGRVSHSLDAVIQRLFGVKVDKQKQVSDWGKLELETEQITYAALDAVLTYKAAKALEPKVIEYKMGRHYKLLKDMQHVVAEMQLEGLPVDWNYYEDLLTEWKKKEVESLEKCKPFFGEVNVRSGKQMNEWLLQYLKDDPKSLALWPKTTNEAKLKAKKDIYVFGKNALVDFKHLPAIGALLEYKRFAKLVDTYGDSLIEKKHPVTGRLHTGYTLGQTSTGRMSSRNPNVQNFPRDVSFRKIFKAPEDHLLVVADFSQIEIRVEAELSKDETMLGWYRDKVDAYKSFGASIYSIPADKITKEQRQIAKCALLGLSFGMRATKLTQYSKNAGIIQPEEFWQHVYNTYHSTLSVYSEWCNKMRDRAEKLGYIETLLGKRRRLTEKEIYTCAPNHCVQGVAAEIMLTALLICKKRIGTLAAIVGTVHDEIILCCVKENAQEAVRILSSSMNDAMKEIFPRAVSHEVAEAHSALRWGEAK